MELELFINETKVNGGALKESNDYVVYLDVFHSHQKNRDKH